VRSRDLHESEVRSSGDDALSGSERSLAFETRSCWFKTRSQPTTPSMVAGRGFGVIASRVENRLSSLSLPAAADEAFASSPQGWSAGVVYSHPVCASEDGAYLYLPLPAPDSEICGTPRTAGEYLRCGYDTPFRDATESGIGALSHFRSALAVADSHRPGKSWRRRGTSPESTWLNSSSSLLYSALLNQRLHA